MTANRPHPAASPSRGAVPPGVVDSLALLDRLRVAIREAISRAGGESSMLADKVLVRRRLPHLDGEKVIQLSLSAMNRDTRHDLLLAPGDVVTVEETLGTVFLDVLKIIRVGISAGGTFF